MSETVVPPSSPITEEATPTTTAATREPRQRRAKTAPAPRTSCGRNRIVVPSTNVETTAADKTRAAAHATASLAAALLVTARDTAGARERARENERCARTSSAGDEQCRRAPAPWVSPSTFMQSGRRGGGQAPLGGSVSRGVAAALP